MKLCGIKLSKKITIKIPEIIMKMPQKSGENPTETCNKRPNNNHNEKSQKENKNQKPKNKLLFHHANNKNIKIPRLKNEQSNQISKRKRKTQN